MKKVIIGIAIAVACAALVVVGVVLVSARQTVEADNENPTVTELKVGRYYLENGTDEEYIEVYDDRSMCMFGFVMPAEASEVQKESVQIFINRKYYAINSQATFIGLSDAPCDEVSIENGNLIGYSMIGDNCIQFSDPHKGLLNYYYKA